MRFFSLKSTRARGLGGWDDSLFSLKSTRARGLGGWDDSLPRGFIFAYDEPLSHLVYAAADMLLVRADGGRPPRGRTGR